MAHEGGYAPRSPDLSAYQPGPAQSSSPNPPYQPNSFTSVPYQPPPYDLNPQQLPPPPPHIAQGYLAPPQGQLYAPPIAPHPAFQPHQPPPIMTHHESSMTSDQGFIPQSAGGSATGARRGRKPKKLKVEEEQQQQQQPPHHVECDKPAPGVAEGIEVRTKFPVARIKRIMQADEDVGKVAQVTPTAVSKALELFMISLVTQSADMARGKGSKKVTAGHLKQVIQQNSTFDFLSEIVSKVPDAPTSKKEHKDDDSEGESKKRRGRAKRRADDDLSS